MEELPCGRIQGSPAGFEIIAPRPGWRPDLSLEMEDIKVPMHTTIGGTKPSHR